MNKSRKKRAFRPGGYDPLEERLVLSPGGAGELAEQLRSLNMAAGEQSAGRGQLRNRRFGRRAQLGRRQFPLGRMRGGVDGASALGPNGIGFNPAVAALGFSDPTATTAALTATNTASSLTGPNAAAAASGFSNPDLNVTNLAQAVAAGSTINGLGLNSGLSNFNGRALGNGLFSNGLGFVNTQSLLGNLSSTIDSSLNLGNSVLNGGFVTDGGLGTNGTFGLANSVLNSNGIGFNGGLGRNNGLGFSTSTSTTTLGTPLSNLTGFNVLGLDRGTRSNTGLDGLTLNPATGLPFGTGTDVDPATGFPIGTGTGGTGGTGTGGTGTGGTGTGAGGTGTGGTGTGGTGGTGTGRTGSGGTGTP